jgi:hypothetical protein
MESEGGESRREKRVEVAREVLERYNAIKDVMPERRGDLIGFERDKFYVALSEEEVYELSPLAYYVWVLCSGDLTVEEIAHQISEGADVDINMVIEPLLIVLEELKKVGLVVY